MAEDEALFQKGMPIRREVLGAEYVDASMYPRLPSGASA
jgi:4-carboxymuconolactone decarboxylase